MSWFTAPTNAATPECPRCKLAGGFVTLVRRTGNFLIFDCRKCGLVPQKEKR